MGVSQIVEMADKPTIVRGISLVIILTVKIHLPSDITVGKCPVAKSLKTMCPFVTNRNAPATISGIIGIVGIGASLFHGNPNGMQFRPAHSVLDYFGRFALGGETTTAFDIAAPKIIARNNRSVSAVTLAAPVIHALFISVVLSNDYEQTIPLTRQITPLS